MTLQGFKKFPLLDGFSFDFHTIRWVLDPAKRTEIFKRNNILGLYNTLAKYCSIAQELPYNLF